MTEPTPEMVEAAALSLASGEAEDVKYWLKDVTAALRAALAVDPLRQGGHQ